MSNILPKELPLEVLEKRAAAVREALASNEMVPAYWLVPHGAPMPMRPKVEEVLRDFARSDYGTTMLEWNDRLNTWAQKQLELTAPDSPASKAWECICSLLLCYDAFDHRTDQLNGVELGFL